MTGTEPTPTPLADTVRRDAFPRIAMPRNVRTIRMVWVRELIHLRRMPTRIVAGLTQPLLFLFILGTGLTPLVAKDSLPGDISYRTFIFPGILAMAIIISALFSAVAIVWDRELGFMREMLVAPVSRTSIVLGDVLGAGSVAVAQGILLIVLAPLIGVDLTVGRVFQLVLALLLLEHAVTAFGVMLASRMERTESFQTVIALVTQPMIFISGAFFPLAGLPLWLGVLCRLNPATYGVDLARRALLGSQDALTIGNWVVPVWFDVAVLLGFACVMVAEAVRLFRAIE